MGAGMQLSDRVGRRMKLQDLHVLMTVVRAGSMGKAAEHLNTSQPNISRSIAGLEHALGVRLLDRRPQGVEPTKYGRALVDCGMAVFDDLRQGVKNIEFLSDPAVGEIRIGGDSGSLSGVVPAAISRLRREFPRIDVHVTLIASIPQQRSALRERRLDLVFGHIAQPLDDDLDIEQLFEELTFFVVAGRHNPWCRRRQIKLAELMQEPWSLPSRDSVVETNLVEGFRLSGLEYPRTRVVTGPINMQSTLVTSGPFLACVSGSVLRLGLLKGQPIKVLPVEIPAPPSLVGITTLKGRTINPVAQLFIKCAREVVKPLLKTPRQRFE